MAKVTVLAITIIIFKAIGVLILIIVVIFMVRQQLVN